MSNFFEGIIIIITLIHVTNWQMPQINFTIIIGQFVLICLSQNVRVKLA